MKKNFKWDQFVFVFWKTVSAPRTTCQVKKKNKLSMRFLPINKILGKRWAWKFELCIFLPLFILSWGMNHHFCIRSVQDLIDWRAKKSAKYTENWEIAWLSQNQRMIWVESDIKDHPVPTPCCRHLPQGHSAQILTNSGSSLRGEGGLVRVSCLCPSALYQWWAPLGRGRAGNRMAADPQPWVSLHFPAPDSPHSHSHR